MARSLSHKKAQCKAAGKNGKTEVKLDRIILDAITASSKKITEIERSGDLGRLKKVARRLKAKRSRQKILQVPQKDLLKARKAMRAVGVVGTVKNMSGTKRISVKE